MNAIAAAATDAIGIWPAIGPSKTAPLGAAFLKLFALTQAPEPPSPSQNVTANLKTKTASSKQVADALIRSMLGFPAAQMKSSPSTAVSSSSAAVQPIPEIETGAVVSRTVRASNNGPETVAADPQFEESDDKTPALPQPAATPATVAPISRIPVSKPVDSPTGPQTARQTVPQTPNGDASSPEVQSATNAAQKHANTPVRNTSGTQAPVSDDPLKDISRQGAPESANVEPVPAETVGSFTASEISQPAAVNQVQVIASPQTAADPVPASMNPPAAPVEPVKRGAIQSRPVDSKTRQGSRPERSARAAAAAPQIAETPSTVSPIPPATAFAWPNAPQVAVITTQDDASVDSQSQTAASSAPAGPVSTTPAAQAPLAFAAELTAIPHSAAQENSDPIEPPAPLIDNKSTPPTHDETTIRPADASPARIVSAPSESVRNAFSAPETPAVSEAETGQKTETPVASAAETMRTAEPVDLTQTAPKITPTTAAVQEIAVRIAAPQPAQRADLQYVDLHLTQRAGEIHVAVRTPDVELQTSLRQDLGSLTNSLERAGYHAETFVPRAAGGSQTSLREERQPGQQGSGRGGAQGDPSGERQKRERRSSSWLEELEQLK